jgi:tetratricopeptide (TPR) repeat protein
MSARFAMALLTAALLFDLSAQTPSPDLSSPHEIQSRLMAGDSGRGRELAEQLVRREPNNPNAWNLLGVARGQSGDRQASEEAFERALKIEPRMIPAWLNLGRLYQMNADDSQSLGKGIKAYDTVIRLDPANAEAHHQLALLLGWKGAFRQSLAHLNRLPAPDQAKVPALALRCQDEAALGNRKAAVDTAETLLREQELQEADVFAILTVVEAHDVEVARILLKGLADRGLASDKSQVRLAALLERKDEFTGARELYEKVAQGTPQAVAPLLDLARVSFKQRDYEGALGYLTHARDLEPGNAGIHFFIGVTCYELRLPLEADKALKEALKIAPDNPSYNYAMGAAQLQWSERGRAVPYLRKFVAARPEDPRGHLALGAAYFFSGEYAQADSELNEAAKARQTRAGAEYLLGRVAGEQNRLSDAAVHFRNSLQADSRMSGAHAELALISCGDKDWKQAVEEAEAALRMDPDDYKANLALMRAYRGQGDSRYQDQVERLKSITQKGEEDRKLLLRTIEVRPY